MAAKITVSCNYVQSPRAAASSNRAFPSLHYDTLTTIVVCLATQGENSISSSPHSLTRPPSPPGSPQSAYFHLMTGTADLFIPSACFGPPPPSSSVPSHRATPSRAPGLAPSGTRIFGIYHAYTWYVPCICRCPIYTCNIHGISMDIPCISKEMDIHGISIYKSCKSIQYIHDISMDIHGYTWYIIWCIKMVCMWYIHGHSWIFLVFWNQISLPARAAGLIQCAHVYGWSRVFYSTRYHGNCARGKGFYKRLNQTAANLPPLSLAAAVTAAAAVVPQASFQFPSLVAGNDLNPSERWGRGSLQGRWPMCRTAK